MTKKELAERIAERAGLEKKVVNQVVGEVFVEIGKALVEGDKVSINDFGLFEIREAEERKGRNPQTGEEITIAAHKKIGFKAFGALKDLVNGQ